jgi:GNAT superfamily N-acetyltransferase
VTRRVVEDASGVLDLSAHGLAVRFQMTVMTRPAGVALTEQRVRGVEVVPVAEGRSLAEAEQILMAVFPPPGEPAYLRGRIQPLRVLDLSGWQVWLAYRGGVPAGAAYTYHDGASLGVYQVGTLPEHRGHGVARGIMLAILRVHPDDVITLTATDQGRPLYTGLGFDVSSRAIWWWPSHTGDDSDRGLR